jgi:hypothetical protein
MKVNVKYKVGDTVSIINTYYNLFVVDKRIEKVEWLNHVNGAPTKYNKFYVLSNGSKYTFDFAKKKMITCKNLLLERKICTYGV